MLVDLVSKMSDMTTLLAVVETSKVVFVAANNM